MINETLRTLLTSNSTITSIVEAKNITFNEAMLNTEDNFIVFSIERLAVNETLSMSADFYDNSVTITIVTDNLTQAYDIINVISTLFDRDSTAQHADIISSKVESVSSNSLDALDKYSSIVTLTVYSTT